MSDILTLKGVTKQYDSFYAVRDLSLRVAAGTIFGLLGPNGAGKTTTIRMIMNILSRTRDRLRSWASA